MASITAQPVVDLVEDILPRGKHAFENRGLKFGRCASGE